MRDEILLRKAEALAGWTTEVRRALHRIPELGFEEHKTRELIKKTLDEIGIPYVAEESWIIAEIKGKKPGKTVALRADFDALPIQEATGLPYASEHPGKMHACGHDSHSAMLLGASKLLHGVREELPGTVRLLFQPAEETTGGAELMIRAGAMRGVDVVYGIHVAGQAPTGRIGTKGGPMYAACDELFIDVLGVSGHGAHPRSGVDAIAIAAQMITALQTLVSREMEATDAAVITIGSIHGGATNNILCDEVKLHGTVRTLTAETRDQLQRRIPVLCEGIAKAMNGNVRVKIRQGYCACVNDIREAERVLSVARRLYGEEKTRVLSASSMGSEDFAYYLLEAPGAMYHVGSGSVVSLHNEHFILDEGCLAVGIAMHAAMAFEYLTHNGE